MNKTYELFNLLADGKWHSTNEIIRAGGHRVSARLFNLRHKLGCIVETEQYGTQFRYKMTKIGDFCFKHGKLHPIKQIEFSFNGKSLEEINEEIKPQGFFSKLLNVFKF